jgi:hypothetical protein
MTVAPSETPASTRVGPEALRGLDIAVCNAGLAVDELDNVA